MLFFAHPQPGASRARGGFSAQRASAVNTEKRGKSARSAPLPPVFLSIRHEDKRVGENPPPPRLGEP